MAIYNIGNNQPEELMHVVALLEKALGRAAEKEMLPMQPGDVAETFADVDDLMRDVGFPTPNVDRGRYSRIRRLVSRPLQGLRSR